MSETVLTPAAIFELRDELSAVRKRLSSLEERFRQLDGYGETLNELDDRADATERRLDIAESTQREQGTALRRLVDSITTRDLVSERLVKYMESIMRHLKVEVAA